MVRSFLTTWTSYLLTAVILLGVLLHTTTAVAQPNPQINYQGKLTDSSGVAVPNGTYNMRFWLLQSTSQATTSAVWTESLTGSDKVQVTNGLFSVMLGSTSPLTAVDFDQTLYLGVEVGGVGGSATWDGEMLPRKPLGTVPAAFESFKLGGVASSSFLRSDTADSASGLISFTSGLLSTASSTITGLSFGTATGTALVIGSDRVTDLTGAGLTNIGGALSVSSSSLNLTLEGLTDVNSMTENYGDLFYWNGTAWADIATSSLGLGNGTFLGLSDTPGSYTANRLMFTNSGGTGLTDSANLTFNGSLLSVAGNLLATASSTIGDGTGAGGLTISGNATTTGVLKVTSSGTSTFTGNLSVSGLYALDSKPVIYGSTNYLGVGYNNTVGSSGVAVGTNNTANNALASAVGYGNLASGLLSTGIGYYNTASGTNSAALGYMNQATSTTAIAIGSGNKSGATQSVAIGYDNKAFASNAIAMGAGVINTVANSLMIGPSNTAKMTILSSGNVGIGSTTPSAKLSVTGNTWLDSNVITFASSSASSLLLRYFTEATSTITDNSAFAFTIATSTSASPIFRIDTSGTYPSTLVDGSFTVNNGAIAYDASTNQTTIENLALGNMTFGDDAGAVSWTDMGITAGPSVGTAMSYTGYIDGNPLLTVYGEADGSGGLKNSAVGIGTTTPWARFSVLGTATDATKPLFTVASSTGTALFHITNAGNVGIGTTSPAQKLSVSGNTYISGTLTAAAAAFTNATSTNLAVTGRFRDGAGSAGSNGYVLQTTGTGVQWVATSSLGIAAGASTLAGLSDVDTTNAATGDLLQYTGSGWATTSTSSLGIVTTADDLTDNSIEDLQDVAAITENYGDLFYWNGTAWADIATSSLGLGNGTFLGLSDTPGSYTSNAIPFVSGSALSFDSTFVYDGTNLGIGTASPGAMLDIFGASNGLRLSYDGSNYVELSSDSNGLLTINSTGGTGSGYTVGSGLAEDTFMIFDGNAADYYLGLDDTDDLFKIGLGNEVGTSTLFQLSSATTTFNTAIVASTTATSTFTNGIALSGGCFRTADGNCLQSAGDTAVVVAASDSSAAEKAYADYVADGVHDEVEINQAIQDAYASGRGGKVYLLEGNFTVGTSTGSDAIVLEDHVSLYGAGQSTSITVPAATNGNIKVIRGGYYNTIADLAISGNGASQTTGTHTGIELWGSSVIENVYVHNMRSYGAYMNNATDVVIAKSTFTDNLSRGIFLNISDNILISNNTISGSPTGVYVYDGSQNQITGNNISGDSGISVVSYSSQNIITNNVIGGITSSGVYLGSTYQNTISNNTFSSLSGGYTLSISSGAEDTVLAANNFYWSIPETSWITDSGIRTNYSQSDRLTVSTGVSRNYNLFSIVGSTTATSAAITQLGTGDIFTLNNASGRQLTVNNSGNLGIGTSSPSAKLSVTGNTWFDSNVISFASSSASSLLLRYFTEATSTIKDNSAFAFTIATSTSASPIFRIDTSGTYANTLVDGSFTVNNGAIAYDAATNQTTIENLALGSMTFADDAGVVNWTDMGITTGAASGDPMSYTAQLDNNPLFTIYGEADGSGNLQNSGVGIGTTTPWARFSVLGTATDATKPLFTVASSTGTALFHITNAGNVGIGTTSPMGKLSVGLTSTAAIADTQYGTHVAVSDTGVITSGKDTTYGNYTSVTRTGATGGAITSYGNYVDVNSDNAGAGNSTSYGVYADVTSGADKNYGYYGDVRNSAGTSYGMYLETTANVGSTNYGLYLNNTTAGGNYYGIYQNDIWGSNYFGGKVGIGTTSPYAKLSVTGDLALTGGIYDNNATRGSNGQVLQTTGTGVQWVATSSLGITSVEDLTNNSIEELQDVAAMTKNYGDLLYWNGSAWADISTSSLGITGGASTFTSLTDTQGSLSANRLIYTNSGGTALTDSADLTFDGTNLAIGTTTPAARLAIQKLAFSTAGGVAGIDQYLSFTNSTNGAVQYGDRAYLNVAATATTTLVGNILRLADSTTYGNTIRGLEVQTNKGTNTKGENTALSGFARTFGVRGTTEGDAGEVAEPAGVFGETRGTTQGNALRGFSKSITSAALMKLLHSTSTFTGTGLLMDFAKDTGTFTGNFIDLQNNSVSYFNINSTGGVYAAGNVGVGTTSPYAKLSVTGDLALTGGIYDNNATRGTNGQILQTNGTGVHWVSTSTLGITGVSTFTALTDTPSSYTANRLMFTNSGATALTDSANLIFDGTKLGIGSTTPNAKLSLQNTGFSGAGVAGFDQYFQTTNSTNGAVQYGDRFYLDAANTATTTIVGAMFRLKDSTTYGNTIRGLEVQTNRGTNTQGENTALSGFARTFGVRGITSGDAGGTYEPAGGYFETQGTTQGNAIRGYSSNITTAALLSLFQASSTFAGTGLEMNFGNTTGSFSSTTSKFLDFQNAGTSVFTVSAYGTTTIGDGTTNHRAGLQIGYGGLCVDNDGSCVASTTGRITSISSQTGHSDLAEMYFSSTELEPGELVVLKGGLSVDRAQKESMTPVLGVVSTNPGLTLGFDDSSLVEGESGYPIALSGRVPVKLSTENGPIAAGDELMLSGLPGVAMKATGTGVVVGIALEDFDDSRLYSETYLNQFGDNMVEPDYEPIFTNFDPRINDNCYYSGGAAIGTEPCVPLTATTSEGQVEEANEIAEQESIEEQLEALRDKKTEIETLTNGTKVKVGQIVMFVDKSYRWFSDSQVASLGMLMSTSSVETVGENEDETLFDRLVALANRFVDGVLSVFTLKADRVETSELCVDGVCVDADDLRHLLDNANQPAPAPTSGSTYTPPPAPAPTPEPTVEEPGVTEGEDETVAEEGEGSVEEVIEESTAEPNEEVPDTTEEVAEEAPEPEPVPEQSTSEPTPPAVPEVTPATP